MEEKIKPVGHLKTTRTSKCHMPNLIHRETGTKAGVKIPFVINARAVLLYDPSLTVAEILDSIDVLRQDIKLRDVNKDER